MEAMTTGQVVPAFRLPGATGGWISLGQYKQRRPLVLAIEEGCPEGFLDGFAEEYPEYRALGAEVLGITRQAGVRDYPFPLLEDETGEIIGFLRETSPAILVLDSFGEIFRRWQGPSAVSPDHEDIRAWVFFTEVQCEECGIHAAHWYSA